MQDSCLKFVSKPASGFCASFMVSIITFDTLFFTTPESANALTNLFAVELKTVCSKLDVPSIALSRATYNSLQKHKVDAMCLSLLYNT